jgi:hypothetical protein
MDQELTAHALVRSASLIGPLRNLKKGSVERQEAKAFVDLLSEMLVIKMGKMRGQPICALVLALKKLGYAQKKLLQAIFYFMADKVRIPASFSYK